MNKKDIKELIDYMKQENMKIISIETDDFEIYLEAFPNDKVAKKHEEKPVEKKEKKTPPPSSSGDLVDIKVDQVGVFYTQPEEDSEETFVSVGDQVEPGDAIGLIETMKIFNEVTVDQAGRIEEILVTNGEAVEYGQTVMRLRAEEA